MYYLSLKAPGRAPERKFVAEALGAYAIVAQIAGGWWIGKTVAEWLVSLID